MNARLLKAPSTPELLRQYECDSLLFSGDQNASYERHLVFDHLVTIQASSSRERFEAMARSLRDLLAQRWLRTDETYDRENPKRVYYLSMEFLIGRTLTSNVINLLVEPLVQAEMRQHGLDWLQLADMEPDAGLGNGGLGRLAACFIDSLATLQIPAMGYGLRYDYGIFRQEIVNGYQIEHPDNWLRHPDPWEVARPDEAVQVRVDCSFEMHAESIRAIQHHPSTILGLPFDRPIVGYGGQTINTLRLWGASSPDFFDFGEFNSGDFVGAVGKRLIAETVTRVLYPDDSTMAGQALRFLQEYLLVVCSLGRYHCALPTPQY